MKMPKQKYTVSIPITVLAEYTVEADTPDQAKEKAVNAYDNEKYLHDVLPSSMAHYHQCDSLDLEKIDLSEWNDHPAAKQVT